MRRIKWTPRNGICQFCSFQPHLFPCSSPLPNCCFTSLHYFSFWVKLLQMRFRTTYASLCKMIMERECSLTVPPLRGRFHVMSMCFNPSEENMRLITLNEFRETTKLKLKWPKWRTLILPKWKQKDWQKSQNVDIRNCPDILAIVSETLTESSFVAHMSTYRSLRRRKEADRVAWL